MPLNRRGYMQRWSSLVAAANLAALSSFEEVEA